MTTAVGPGVKATTCCSMEGAGAAATASQVCDGRLGESPDLLCFGMGTVQSNDPALVPHQLSQVGAFACTPKQIVLHVVTVNLCLSQEYC